jgi:hypothetical protein
LFKPRGRGRGDALVYPAFGEAEPGCLITNAPRLSGHDYALRNWQAPSCRDRKSGGWNWQQSPVWQPDHAQVRLLVLALAYAWVVSPGTQRLYSVFREGLRYWLDLLYAHKPLYLGLFFAPDILLTWTLSSPQPNSERGIEGVRSI